MEVQQNSTLDPKEHIIHILLLDVFISSEENRR